MKEVEYEGKHAIDSPGMPKSAEMPPEEYQLEENEERSMIEPKSYDNPRLQQLMRVLIDWMNDELHGDRIIVQDIEEDLYDGQVLQKFMEKLTEEKLNVPELTQNEEGQRNKLKVVLNFANRILGLQRGQPKWSVESVHTKNIVSILHLLVALARHFRAPIRLPENVVVDVVIVQKKDGYLQHRYWDIRLKIHYFRIYKSSLERPTDLTFLFRTIAEELTSNYDDLGLKCERDAFDTLFDHAPDKLQVVKKSLITFANKHLNKINLEVVDLDNQFADGVFLVLLVGLLENYFVPLYEFHITPQVFDEKVINVALAFELMQDAGLPKPKARPEDIVNNDLKSTLRVLYNLFTKYKHLN